VYPDSGRDAGIAAALLPAVGTAVEATYTRGARWGATALSAPVVAAPAVRRATGRPTSAADLFTWPLTACSLGLALRVREHTARNGHVRAEEVRRRASTDGAAMLGREWHAREGGRQALDSLLSVYQLLAQIAGSDREKELLDDVRALRRELDDQAPARTTGPGPALLAVALRQYEKARSNALLDRRVFLTEDSEAHDPSTGTGRLLLDDEQVGRLTRALEREAVAGDITVRVRDRQERPTGWDLVLGVTQRPPRGGPERSFDIALPLNRPAWRLELATVGLAAESVWLMSICSPGHAHVPVRVMAPVAAVNLMSAAVAEYVQRSRPTGHNADLTLLLLPSALYAAVAGARTMRRSTFNPGGTPFHPGLHVLCGALYLWGTQFPDMSRRGKAGVLAGCAAMVGTSWGVSRRRPGDGPAFAVEMVWSALAGVGSVILGKAVRDMGERVTAEQRLLTEQAARQALLDGWQTQARRVQLMHDHVSDYLDRLLTRTDTYDGITAKKIVNMARQHKRAADALAKANGNRPSAAPSSALIGG
jgi:hypothetical protein